MPNNGFGDVIKHNIYAGASYSDEDLVALVQERGPTGADAMTSLLRRYQNPIYRACLVYLRDSALAEDASQEVLVRVYRGINRFQGRSSFRTWLYRIVRNQCFTLSARQDRDKLNESLDEAIDQYAAVNADYTNTFAEEKDSVHTALKNLSPQHREVIRLRFFSDLSLHAVATQLDISLSAAKMRLYRALEKFEGAYGNLQVSEPLP
ncbi:MAG: sigma-70 family RNA polymerase sigma factor [Gammaproteobacteria bacterium]|nr:sigma-70 family RNA polymerase sigma factor [Gammaproteobacteria bacterium]